MFVDQSGGQRKCGLCKQPGKYKFYVFISLYVFHRCKLEKFFNIFNTYSKCIVCFVLKMFFFVGHTRRNCPQN